MHTARQINESPHEMVIMYYYYGIRQSYVLRTWIHGYKIFSQGKN